MQPLQIPPHLNSKWHHDDDDDHQCINAPIKNENCAESEEKKRFVKMVQKWFIMLCKLANGNISENVILIRNTAECSFFCPIGKCDWYCWPRTRETFHLFPPGGQHIAASMQLFTFSHNTSIRTASLYPGIYEPLIIKPKPCHIFTEKKFSVRSFFPGDSFVSFFVPPSHWPRAFSREETFQLVGALVHWCISPIFF